MKRVEYIFEKILWNARFIVVLAVMASLLASIAVFIVGSYNMVRSVGSMFTKLSLDTGLLTEGTTVSITHIINVVDNFLLATVLLIFALGLYELFISKIDEIEDETNANRPTWLIIHNLDDLKEKLVKVIIMILIVTFYEKAVEIHWDSPLNVLYLAVAIAFIALALLLLGIREDRKGNIPHAPEG